MAILTQMPTKEGEVTEKYAATIIAGTLAELHQTINGIGHPIPWRDLTMSQKRRAQDASLMALRQLDEDWTERAFLNSVASVAMLLAGGAEPKAADVERAMFLCRAAFLTQRNVLTGALPELQAKAVARSTKRLLGEQAWEGEAS